MIDSETDVENSSTIAMQALKSLIERLGRGDFPPGERIRELPLARELNISCGALREALRRIQEFGIIEYTPFRGYRVKIFTLRDMFEIEEIRMAAEPVAARRVASCHTPEMIAGLARLIEDKERAIDLGDRAANGTADMEFHFSVLRFSGNRLFASICDRIKLMKRIFDVLLPKGICGSEHLLQLSSDKNYPLGGETCRGFDDFRMINIKSERNTHRAMFNAIADNAPREAEALFRIHCAYQLEVWERLLAEIGDIPVTDIESVVSEKASAKGKVQFGRR